MNTFTQGWYLIYTRPQREKKVASYLFQNGINAYLPLVKTLRQWHDRKKYIEAPLFPSYVFVYLKDVQCYYTSLSCDGALYFVKTKTENVRVSEKIIQDIQLVVSNAKDVEVSVEKLAAGQKVLVVEGPFAGLTCEVIEHKSRQKISVHVQCLQRNLLVQIPREFVTTIIS